MLVHISHVPFFKYSLLVLVIIACCNLVNYACVCKERESLAGRWPRKEGDLGIGEPALLGDYKKRFANRPITSHKGSVAGFAGYRLSRRPPDFINDIHLMILKVFIEFMKLTHLFLFLPFCLNCISFMHLRAFRLFQICFFYNVLVNSCSL